MALKHTLLALVVVLVWSLNFVVIDLGMEGVPPLLFLALRFLVIAIPAVFFIRPPRIGWRRIVLIGLFLSFGQFVLLYVGLAVGLPPGLASLLAQTQVLYSIVLSAVFLHERPTTRQIVGVLIGMIGLVVVIAGRGLASPWIPIVLVLGSALSWAIGNTLIRHAKVQSGFSLVVWSSVVVPVPSILLSLAIDSPAVVFGALVGLSLPAILATLYSAVAASLLGYGIWNSLLARYPTSAVVPFTLLIPPLGIFIAWLVVREAPTVAQLVGGFVMLLGLAIAMLQRWWRKRNGSVGAVVDGGAPELT